MRLLESNATRRRSRSGTLLSVAAHAAIIALAAVATAHADDVREADPAPEPLIYVVPPARASTATTPSPAPARPDGAAPPSTAAPTVPAPPVPIVSIDVPTALPDPGTMIDPTRGLAGSFTHGLGAASAGTGSAGTGSGADASSGAPFASNAVERIAEPLEAPRPRYPEMLRSAGIEGTAVVRFVVDTLARVEPGSVAVERATHPAFGSAALAVVPRMRFRPAEVAGRRVRQLVEQPFDFRLR